MRVAAVALLVGSSAFMLGACSSGSKGSVQASAQTTIDTTNVMCDSNGKCQTPSGQSVPEVGGSSSTKKKTKTTKETSPPTTADHHGDLRGTFTLNSSSVLATGASCEGTGGYSDIQDGTQVVVKNASGTIVGTGSLTYDSGATLGCTFTFDVPNLPKSAFYQVEVSHRGAITYSRSQLDASDWSIATSLG